MSRGGREHDRQPRRGSSGSGAPAAADRLWPVLLDRLTDEEPGRKTESAEARVMTRTRFRESVLRDIRWLLNTTNAESHISFEGYPDARRSVLNFGLDPISGARASELDRHQLEEAIRRAIMAFEPRLLPDALEVRVISEQDTLDLHNVIAIEIRGQLWSVPYPLEMLLRSDVDLETGHIVLRDESRGVG